MPVVMRARPTVTQGGSGNWGFAYHAGMSSNANLPTIGGSSTDQHTSHFILNGSGFSGFSDGYAGVMYVGERILLLNSEL